MPISMRFTGMMSIGGGEPVEVKFTGVADTPKIWGGAPPYVDIGLPGVPPGIWGGAPPYVDIGGPGPQPHPEHPIVISRLAPSTARTPSIRSSCRYTPAIRSSCRRSSRPIRGSSGFTPISTAG